MTELLWLLEQLYWLTPIGIFGVFILALCRAGDDPYEGMEFEPEPPADPFAFDYDRETE